MVSAVQAGDRPQGNGKAEAKPDAAGVRAPSHPSRESEGMLAALSTMINDNLSLFRAATATMVVGSALTVSFLLYRRGLHGFGSAAQVPASYFERRKRVRVRIAKIVEEAAVPPNPDGALKGGNGRYSSSGHGGGTPTVSLQDGAYDGSDVLLHAEHITFPRRLLRLPPRSLLPSAGGIDAATFTLRLCGVSAAEEGVTLAREELVKPLVGWFCDAELLYREQRSGASSSRGGQASRPIAVCHIHRRRGVLWRDILQPRLDPKAGFGEHLLSEGLAVLREEVWWAPRPITPSPDSEDATTEASTQAHPRSAAGDAPVVTDGHDSKQPFPALRRLLEDRERFVAAEKSAELARRGLWELTTHEELGREKTASGMVREDVVSMGLKQRSAAVVHAFMSLFGRGQK
eukprot:g15573.t1